MIEGTFLLPAWYDLLATFAFAVTGAIVGLEKKYDIVGVFALAIAVAIGGGVMRDGIFLNQVPAAFTDWRYFGVIGVAVISTIFLHNTLTKHWRVIGFIDALGLAAYTVVGTQKSLYAGLTITACILVGTVNAVGGGILRDVLAGDKPPIFQPSQLYAIIAVAGSTVFIMMAHYIHIPAQTAAITTIFLMVSFRIIVMALDIKTAPAAELPKPIKAKIKRKK